MKCSIEADNLKAFAKKGESKDALAFSHAVLKNGLFDSAIDAKKIIDNPNVFNVEVKAGDITNQNQSGRCWMFAGLNAIRSIMFEKLGVKNIELSQAYLQFYDRLEKANFFYEWCLKNPEADLSAREYSYVLSLSVGDGGHWAMFANLVNKYGVVPQSEMPDWAVNKSTRELENYLGTIFANDYKDFRLAAKEGKSEEELRALKEEKLKNLYRFLVISLGVPPKKFTFEYVNKDDKAVRLKTLTPKAFYDEYIGEDLSSYVCLTNAPIAGFDDYVKYVAKNTNTIIGGDPVQVFNVSLDEFRESLIAALKGNTPVWFGAEVQAESMRSSGLLVKDIYRLGDITGIDDTLSKGERLDYKSVYCDHAMTFVGVNLDDKGVPNRYKVANSWGKDVGKDGYFIMDEAWFETYVYEIFVPRKYIKDELLKKYDDAPIVEVDPYFAIFALSD